MESRFGLKDFVLLVLVLGVAGLVALLMFQEDRKWEQFRQLNTRVESVEKLVGRVARAIDQGGPLVSGPRDGPDTPPARDESWARPGVTIQWQPAWTFFTDARQTPAYREGGTFTEIFEARPAKVTPYIQTDVYGRRIIDVVMESLAQYDPKTLRLRGQLAEAWQVDPKGLWLRAKLRPGVRWSDGQPITSEDFRFAWYDVIMNPQIEAQRDRAVLQDKIKSVASVRPDVVEFEFRSPMFDNASSALGLWPLPKHLYSVYTPKQINTMPGLLIGSGPYKMKTLEWTPDVPLILIRNEQYWGPRTAMDEMRYTSIDDENPRLVAYRNGEGDMVTPSAPQFVKLRDDAQFAAENQMLNWLNMRSGRSAIIWNCGKRGDRLTPFADKRVRRAMTMLLDREQMIRDIWKGVGQVCNGYLGPGSLGFDPNLKAWGVDRPAALALLKEAGWEDRNGDRRLEDKDGNPFVFEFVSFGGGPIAERISLFIQDAYGSVGIKAIPRTMDWSVGEQVRKQRDFDAMLMAWGANAPESDPKQIFHSDSIKDQGDNFAQYSSPEMDKTIDALRLELDDDKRAVLWGQFSRVMREDEPYTWIRVAPYLRFIKPDVGNVHTYPKGLEPWEYFRGGRSTPAPVN